MDGEHNIIYGFENDSGQLHIRGMFTNQRNIQED